MAKKKQEEEVAQLRYIIKSKMRKELQFTPEMLINIFILLHDDWFISRSNEMFQKQEETRAYLLHFLLTGEYPDNEDPAYAIYAVTSFENEFLNTYFERR